MTRIKKATYSEKYKRGNFQDKESRPLLIQKIKDAEQIELLEAGLYKDGEGYLIIRFDFKNNKGPWEISQK